jgi:PST family polysaccharide transporter
MDKLLVGWRFNALSLGFYKKAFDLFALSTMVGSISNVAVSALSRLRHDSLQYRRHLLNTVSVMSLIGMALGADLTLVGGDVIRLLLGPGWEPAERIFTIFGPGIGAMFLYTMHGWVHLSIGRPERWFRWGLVEFVFTGLLFVIGLRWGPEGVAAAWTASFWILTIPAFWYAGHPIGLGVGPIVSVVWRPVVASVAGGVASAAVATQLALLVDRSGPLETFERVVVHSLLFVVLYVAAVIVLHRGWGPLSLLGRLLREMVPHRLPQSLGAVARPAPGVSEHGVEA